MDRHRRAHRGPSRQHRPHRFAALLAACFLLFSLFGAFLLSFADAHEMMPNCASMREQTLCPMRVLEHLGTWRRTIESVLPESVLLLGTMVLLAWITPRGLDGFQLGTQSVHRRFERHRHPETLLFQPLAIPLQHGIIHPKILALADAA